jgi:hypothetical protein
MTHFEFLTVALSFVLGLSVTVLLTSLLNAFRARRKLRLSWLPLAWATFILVIQFDVWWELYGLSSMHTWSVGAFVLLLLLALLLFVAGGLILPTGIGDYPEDLDEYFQDDGRWAIAVIAAFNLTAIIANYALFDVSILDPMNTWNMIAIAIAVVVIGATRSVVQGAATVAYGVWLGIYMWTFVPRAY